MYRGFWFWFLVFVLFCGCKWSYFTPPFSCHTTFHVLLKGMLVVSRVCVSLLHCCSLPARWLLCVWLSLPPGGSPAFSLSTPKHFCQEKFERAGSPGSLDFCFLPIHKACPPPFLLDFPGFPWELLKFLGNLAGGLRSPIVKAAA